MSQSKIDTLVAAVPIVVAEAAEAQAAHDEVDAAAAALLQRVIDIAKPAIRYVGTRPRTAMADECDNQTAPEFSYYDHRCIAFFAEPGPEIDERGNYGRYRGYDLFLREDGRLVQFQYAGYWDAYQGSAIWWSAVERDGDERRGAGITVYATAADAVRDGWRDVEDYVAAISDAITGAAGTRQRSTRAARDRAARLTAAAQLLGVEAGQS